MVFLVGFFGRLGIAKILYRLGYRGNLVGITAYNRVPATVEALPGWSDTPIAFRGQGNKARVERHQRLLDIVAVVRPQGVGQQVGILRQDTGRRARQHTRCSLASLRFSDVGIPPSDEQPIDLLTWRQL